MKKSILLVMFAVAVMFSAKAQHVSVRLNFPVGVHTRAYGNPPFRGAIWIGPEWQWRNGRYVSVPGYWAKPRRYHAVWIQGHWQATRGGYRWVPGHWR